MAETTPGPWRTGRKVFRTIYGDPTPAAPNGRLIGVMDRPEDAALVVRAINERDKLLAACDDVRDVLAGKVFSRAAKYGEGGRVSFKVEDVAELIRTLDDVIARADGLTPP